MFACWSWLCVDYFVEHGFALEQERDGRRWAIRGHMRLEVARYCGHLDCPPHAARLIDSKDA